MSDNAPVERSNSLLQLTMSLVHVHNEWDPLEEVVIGTARGARVPSGDTGLLAIEFSAWESTDNIPSGPLPERLIEETESELACLCRELQQLGAVVRRPGPRNTSATITTPDWQADGLYAYCHRMPILIDRFGAREEAVWHPYTEDKTSKLEKALGIIWGSPLRHLI